MVSSIRALIGLVACGLALLIALIAMERRHDEGERSVLELDPTHVAALSWSGESIRLVRSGQGWAFVDAPKTPVVARAVEDVVTSLRSARWHRRGGSHAVHRTLTITIGSFQHEVGIGEVLAGTDQTWIVVDGSAFLVDGWLAKLLDPSVLAFRERTPLAAAATAVTIHISGAHDLELAGRPWRSHAELVTPELGDALASALAKLQLVAPAPVLAGPITTIELPGVVARVGAACGAGVAIVVGEAAPACADGWPDVLGAIDALARPDVVDRRPAGFAFDRISFADAELVLGKQPTIAIHGVTHPADPDRLAELVHVLAEPGEPVAVPTTPPQFTLAIAPITLEVYGDVVHRRGEPHALRIAPDARAILARTPIELVDAERWAEEPTTITQIELDGVTYKRGAVIGEWSGARDPALVEALASAVAKLHAPARSGTAMTPHHVRFTVAPPVGAALTHELSLGTPTATGCPAVIDRELVTAPLALCTAVAALAR